MKKNNLKELKETTTRKNQIARSTRGQGCQKKTCQGWRANFVT